MPSTAEPSLLSQDLSLYFYFLSVGALLPGMPEHHVWCPWRPEEGIDSLGCEGAAVTRHQACVLQKSSLRSLAMKPSQAS